MCVGVGCGVCGGGRRKREKKAEEEDVERRRRKSRKRMSQRRRKERRRNRREAELVWGREAGVGRGYSPLGSSLPWREDCCRGDRVLFYQSSRVDKMSAMTEKDTVRVKLQKDFITTSNLYCHSLNVLRTAWQPHTEQLPPCVLAWTNVPHRWRCRGL